MAINNKNYSADKRAEKYYTPSVTDLVMNQNSNGSYSLFVGNIKKGCKSSTLKEIFSRYGVVSGFRIIPDNGDNDDLYGFVDLITNHIEKPLNDEIFLEEIKLSIRLAKTKSSRHKCHFKDLKKRSTKPQHSESKH